MLEHYFTYFDLSFNAIAFFLIALFLLDGFVTFHQFPIIERYEYNHVKMVTHIIYP